MTVSEYTFFFKLSVQFMLVRCGTRHIHASITLIEHCAGEYAASIYKVYVIIYIMYCICTFKISTSYLAR